MNKICIVGSGFVGLVTGAYFSDQDHLVHVVDSDSAKVSKINNEKKAPFFEPGLNDILKKNLGKNLILTNNLKNSIAESNEIFICVGTPVSPSGAIDLHYIDSVTKEIGLCLSKIKEFKTIIIKSTVIPGTTGSIVKNNLEKYSKKIAGKDFGIAMNPEFLREGSAVVDTYNPDRIIVGANNEEIAKKVLSLYASNDNTDYFITSLETAEISKYCSNSFFAMLISFANEISKICELFPSVDSRDVFESLYSDRRIKKTIDNNNNSFPELISYLWPGIGYGGSCFPKDILALENFAKKNSIDLPIISGISITNKNQTNHLVNKFIKTVKPKKIGILGLSFKPETDDLRFSKSIEIIKILNKKNIEIFAFDPKVKKLEELDYVKILNSAELVVKKSDSLIIATSWREFKEKKFIDLLNKSKLPILDARLFLPKDMSNDLYILGPGFSSIDN